MLFARAAKAVTIDQTHPALASVMKRVGDHNAFVSPAMVISNDRQNERKPTRPSGQLLTGPLGYVQVPHFSGALPIQATRFAQQIQNLIKQLDGSAPIGWIVDLRGNMGGNRWAMLAGLGPLLGEGLLGAFAFPDGQRRAWYYRNGTAGLEGDPVLPPPRTRPNPYFAKVRDPYRLSVPDARVAVLMGKNTASAGEAVVLAFRGRSHWRTFGAPTAGLNTAVGITELSDGAWILLAMALNADRSGREFNSPISPDEEVTGNDAAVLADDAVVRAASTWLLGARNRYSN
jgi:C-terminal processing protease CtpA/Prc